MGVGERHRRRGRAGGGADLSLCPAEAPVPLAPTDTDPCGAQPPVRPGCDSEGNQPAGPLAPGGASPSSDPGIEADLGSGSSGGRGGRRSSQDLSSPGSDYEDVGGARLGRMISSISETELERSSDDGSSSSGRSSHLTNSIEEASSPASEPEPEPEPPCEPPRRPAFLPVGPEDTNSEYESGSESEPDLSEDADSPWLLSNLVSRMISEGSSPIRCPGQCLSPSPRPAGEPASPAGEAPAAAAAPGGVELVDMETLCGPPPPAPPAPRPGPAQPGPCLFLSNPTRDTITPLWAAPGRPARPGRACSAACSDEDDEDEEEEDEAEAKAAPPGGRGAGPAALDASLVYDAVKYTLVVDEHTQLELVSLRRCAGLGEDSEDSGGEASEEEAGAVLLGGEQGPGDASPDSPDLTFSKKFLNVFVNSTSRSSSEWEGGGGGSRGAGWLLAGGRRSAPKSQDSLRVCGWPALGTALLPSACVGAFPGYPRVGSGERRLLCLQPQTGPTHPRGPRGGGPGWPSSASLSLPLCFSLSGTESFGLFSCLVNGEEREQTHRAVFRYRHPPCWR